MITGEMIMSMTKKDFQAMADAVKDARRDTTLAWGDGTAAQASALAALDTVSERLATACARQYRGGYGFNRARFLRACGLDEPRTPTVRVLNDNEPDRL